MSKNKTPETAAGRVYYRSRAKAVQKLISMRPETAEVLASLPRGEMSRFIENCLWRSKAFREHAAKLGHERKPRQFRTFEKCTYEKPGSDTD